jgi:hypothetical protein
MSISEALGQLFFGIILGALGQGLRALVGLKKAQETAAAAGNSFRDSEFDGTRLGISLFIGGIVGGLTELSLSGFKPLGSTIDESLILKLIAAGYAGTDVIEGLMQKFLPASAPAAQPQSKPAAPVARAAALTAVVGTAPKAATSPVDSTKSLQVQIDVAFNVFPACATPGPGGRVTIDPTFQIADQCSASPDNVALDINTAATTSAALQSLTWNDVMASDVSGLKTVKDLMALVDKHLA